MKKLRRAKEGKKIAGVCKGLSKAFDIDVSYVRLAFVFLAILPFITLWGMGLLYLALALIVPEEEDYIDV